MFDSMALVNSSPRMELEFISFYFLIVLWNFKAHINALFGCCEN